jgi:hypothetical protein
VSPLLRAKSKAARNDGRKLLAGTINTVGLAVFGLGFLTPVFTEADVSVGRLAASCVIFAAGHVIAHLITLGLEE